jgi:restriction system protein
MAIRKLSFKSAAIAVLEKSQKPLSAAEITKIALAENILVSSGSTPEASMAAQIYVDINKNKDSPFQKVGKGLFIIKNKSSEPTSLQYTIDAHNESTRERLRQLLFTMDPFQFEYLAADLLQKIGYENVTVTKRSGDKGIDINANLTVGGVANVKTVIQVKRYAANNKVNGSIIAQLRGSAEVDQRGLVITTSDFTKDGIMEAKAPNKMPVSLVNGDKLIQLLIKYGVGVKKEELYILSLDEEFFQSYSSDEGTTPEIQKSRSIWLLPGGVDRCIDTLNLFLEELKKGNNSKESLVNWYFQNFKNLESQNSTQSYVNLPRNLGLTRYENRKYYLTADGESYFTSKSKQLLYEIISKNILAFDDIYEFIKSSSSSVDEEEILNYLKVNFDIEWTTYAQVNFRLIWLMNLDKISKTANGYKA